VITQGVSVGNDRRGRGRIEVRADDRSLTGHGGLAVIGDLEARLGLIDGVDGELARERRARPVKVRRRGASPGELVMALAECQLVGGAFFDHLADQRADTAGAVLRAVSEVPSPAAALQNAKRFRRVHCQRIERAMAAAGQRLDRQLGRDPGEAVTVDLDATKIVVYGRRKEGAARCRTGEMSYAPHLAFWAERGRALTGELVPGNQEHLERQGVREDRLARAVTVARRSRPGHDADRLRLLRDRAATPPPSGEDTLHRVGATQHGDVEGAGPDPRERLA
jgi:hypothetical protein